MIFDIKSKQLSGVAGEWSRGWIFIRSGKSMDIRIQKQGHNRNQFFLGSRTANLDLQATLKSIRLRKRTLEIEALEQPTCIVAVLVKLRPVGMKFIFGGGGVEVKQMRVKRPKMGSRGLPAGKFFF